MAKQPKNIPFIIKSCKILVLLLLLSQHVFCQTITNTDSANLKPVKKSPIVDGTPKSGTAKLVLLRHTKTIPLPALQDADHDGIPDQLDLEPNTPEGADVDSHGRALDTDGDGVPDYKDKEKLTLKKCFPVDSNGVCRCTEPRCCSGPYDDSDMNCCCVSCNMAAIPPIQFRTGSWSLSQDALRSLVNVASKLKVNPDCTVKIIGYYRGVATGKTQQLSWDRVNVVIKYLVEKQGVSESRFIFIYGQHGNINGVDLVPSKEGGKGIPLPPSLNLH